MSLRELRTPTIPSEACAELGNGVLISCWVGRCPQEATPHGCVLLIPSLSSPAPGSMLLMDNGPAYTSAPCAAPAMLPSHTTGHIVPRQLQGQKRQCCCLSGCKWKLWGSVKSIAGRRQSRDSNHSNQGICLIIIPSGGGPSGLHPDPAGTLAA